MVRLPHFRTTKDLPTKRLKGALETTLKISKGERMGSLSVYVLSEPGTKVSCRGVSRAEAGVCVLFWGKESHFLIHTKVQIGVALIPSGKKWKLGMFCFLRGACVASWSIRVSGFVYMGGVICVPL